MVVELDLSPKDEAQFVTWAARHGKNFEQAALALYHTRADGNTVAILFLEANQLLSCILDSERDLSGGNHLLLLLQTMVALHHANGGRSFTSAELDRHARLEEAMNLFDLEVVSLEIGARLAGISQREFLDALGKARISALQYSAEEAIAEAQAA